MRCPYCGYNATRVIDKRNNEAGDVVRRRRECLKCKKRFTTYERVEQIGIIVIKKDKTRERFNRDKLLKGIIKACEKRPISIEKIEKLADEVESELMKEKDIEIPSKLIGKIVMEKLKKLDKVAYIRFASVYREFKDVGEFVKEVKKL